MIYTGGGVILGEASGELTEFVRLLGYPITSTLMGLGAYPATDKQFLGMLGMHGTYEANMAMHHCDVLIAIGARFDDRVTGDLEKFCPDASIIHIDIDPSSISKNVPVDIPIVGDVKFVLKELIALLNEGRQIPDKQVFEPWLKQIREWASIDCLKYNRSSDVIKPQYVIEKLYELTGGEAYITSDVGQHQMWAAQYYKFDKPRRWINSGGLGTMGFCIPSGIGAKIGRPDKTVVTITGDGSFQMTIQELATIAQDKIAVKIAIIHNCYLGMVRQWQELFYKKR